MAIAAPSHAPPVLQILSLNGDGDSRQIRSREYKRRKLHRKTTAGCSQCKAKRVKCDESRPSCIRCQRNCRACSYSPDPDRCVPQENIRISRLNALTLTPSSVSSSEGNGTSTIHLIQHVHTHWSDIFHIAPNEAIMFSCRSSPLVNNTILAIAACHLRHTSPTNVSHRIAEHFQQSLALQEFQLALDTPREALGQTGVDMLMLSAMLLNMIAFALPEHENTVTIQTDPRTSWVFSTREDRLDWLALQVGLRPLLLSVSAYLDNTLKFLTPILFGGMASRADFQRHATCPAPPRWIEFFNLDPAGSGCDPYNNSQGDVFRAPVSIVLYARDLEPVPANVFKNIMFLAKVQHGFRALLLERDPKALWLFGYWLGVMCRYDGIWWCQKRAARDYSAICVWLQRLRLTEKPGAEGTMWTEMMKELEWAPVWTAN